MRKPSQLGRARLQGCTTINHQPWQARLPEQANAVLMVPLHNGQQILAVLQGQLADVHQALLIVGAQDGTPVGGHRGFLGRQG